MIPENKTTIRITISNEILDRLKTESRTARLRQGVIVERALTDLFNKLDAEKRKYEQNALRNIL